MDPNHAKSSNGPTGLPKWKSRCDKAPHSRFVGALPELRLVLHQYIHRLDKAFAQGWHIFVPDPASVLQKNHSIDEGYDREHESAVVLGISSKPFGRSAQCEFEIRPELSHAGQ